MGMFSRRKKAAEEAPDNRWARPEMLVTFRAEIMPGKLRDERTFRIQFVRPNGRVILYDFPGEHREGAFEPLNFKRDLVK
jgi:hypothetical protein